MTEQQAESFLMDTFTAFPSIWQWMHENSPDPKATLGIWARQLAGIELSEAISVLNRWTSNKLAPPTGYRKENFIQQVLGVVYADRDKAARQRQVDKAREYNERGGIFTKVPILGPFMSDVASVMAEFNTGIITCEQKDAEIRRLEREAHANIDANYARRSA